MEHLAVIMDGNGRWAEKLGRERTYGYRFGAEAFMRLLEDFLLFPISVLTVYAFSTENKKRSNNEVEAIFTVIASFLIEKVIPFCKENSISLRFIGNTDDLPADFKNILSLSPNGNNSKTVVIAINYGSLDEVCRAFESLCEKGYSSVSPEQLISALDTAGLPMPDAVLRYGGYKRLSNFLLLQSAYSELFFTDKLWPDYQKEDIESILSNFSDIKRNFGGNHA